ncbi:MAG TPA: multicopper oxidase domain-containing protein [Roseiflexaceae bacterium]|nr:multicopper oxidase domain-containing protein [Roseiflexaceae bacterium]
MAARLSRRSLLLGVLALTGGAALTACGMTLRATSTPAPGPTPRQPRPDFVPDLEIRLHAAPAEVAILPGRPTQVWRYQAELLQGDPASLQPMPDSFLGPTIRVRRGQKVRVHFSHTLPGPDTRSIIHWHGLALPSEQDAHPRYAIRAGQTYVYEFTVQDRAGTYWYHPHPDMQTGRQVYQGLAGLFIVSDDEEQALGLPSGAQDIPLVIQDRTFDAQNQLVYAAGDPMAGSMDDLMGVLGARVLVNGRPDATLDVATRAYRLRLLNGSNARTYTLGWGDGTPLTVIASDGGLLEQPVARPYVMLAPGERVELWVDFQGRAVGAALALVSLPFEGAEGAVDGGHDTGSGHGGHDMSGMRGGHIMAAVSAAPPQGAALHILHVRVSEQVAAHDMLPTTLSSITRHRAEDAVNRDRPRTFTITQPGRRWELNGRVYEPDAVADDERVRLGDLEVWELVNALNAGDTQHPQGMLHPFHVHGLQFQVLSRTVLPELRAGWERVSAGYVDEGWKDTVLLMPGERVQLLLRFAEHTGTYMLHCHLLEHEDMGLMRNIEVVA